MADKSTITLTKKTLATTISGVTYHVDMGAWDTDYTMRVIDAGIRILIERSSANNDTEATRTKKRTAKAACIGRGEWSLRTAPDHTVRGIREWLMSKNVAKDRAKILADQYAECDEAEIPEGIRAHIMALRSGADIKIDLSKL